MNCACRRTGETAPGLAGESSRSDDIGFQSVNAGIERSDLCRPCHREYARVARGTVDVGHSKADLHCAQGQALGFTARNNPGLAQLAHPV